MIKLLLIFSIFQISLYADENKTTTYKGYWRFDRVDFEKRHKYMFGFLINKALNTRLQLTDEHYIQYLNPTKIYKDKRKIISVLKLLKDNKLKGWEFTRIENEKKITFSIVKDQEYWYFREAKKEYQLIKESESDYKKWLQNNR
jgi:hypothetical protein